MTLQELNQHFALLEQLRELQERLEYFQSKATAITSRLTGMPRGNGITDKVGTFAAEIADMTAEIQQLEVRIQANKQSVIAFIETIPDCNIRLILRLRFIHGLPWKEVADLSGQWSTEDSVRGACYRYLGKFNRSRQRVL